MVNGYIALTEMTAEKEMFVYYGNIKCPELMFSGRFKFHLIPGDITYVTLVYHDFITGTRETDSIVSLEDALDSGFMKPLTLKQKDMTLTQPDPLLPKTIKNKSKKRS